MSKENEKIVNGCYPCMAASASIFNPCRSSSSEIVRDCNKTEISTIQNEYDASNTTTTAFTTTMVEINGEQLAISVDESELRNTATQKNCSVNESETSSHDDFCSSSQISKIGFTCASLCSETAQYDMIQCHSTEHDAAVCSVKIAKNRNLDCLSWTSNVLFLLGSASYVQIAIFNVWNLKYDAENRKEERYDADSSLSLESAFEFEDQEMVFVEFAKSTETSISHRKTLYTVISIIGALCYLMNAASDTVRICSSTEQDDNKVGKYEKANVTSSQTKDSFVVINNIKGRFRGVNISTALMACLFFGFAAGLDLVAVLLRIFMHPSAFWFAATAVHFYLLSALLFNSPLLRILFRTRCYTNESSNLFHKTHLERNSFKLFADLLFMTGSLIDLIICYCDIMNYIDREVSSAIVTSGYLISSMLWLVDALIYIFADFFGPRYKQIDDPLCEEECSDLEKSDQHEFQ